MDIFADLEAENERLEAILDSLDDDQWTSPSGAPDWSVADVALHLAQSDEAVAATVNSSADGSAWRMSAENVDDLAAAMVHGDRMIPVEVFARWKAARRASIAALRSAPPNERLRWAAAPLKPATLATTRLAEHWAHGLDITTPLGIEFPDTDRLRHIAWLGHSTFPYAFSLAGVEPRPLRCELIGPNGDTWSFGPPEVSARIVGLAGEFCRIGARRLAPIESHLSASNPDAQEALRLLRNYAY